jgi:hypothetical protein
VFPDTYRQRSACFAYIASTTFARNVVNALCCALGIIHGSGSHACAPKCVSGLENRPDVVAVPNPLELIRDALHIGDDRLQKTYKWHKLYVT